MIEYLYQLPCNVLGHSMLGYLDLIDIIQFENAAASHQSQKFLRSILPYSPPTRLSETFNKTNFKLEMNKWFSERQWRVHFVSITLESLCEVNSEFDNIELLLSKNSPLTDVQQLNNHCMIHKLTCVRIVGDQDPAVMEVLFSLLIDSSVHSLNIQSSNQSQWIEYILNLMLT